MSFVAITPLAALSAQLSKVKTGALVIFGEDDTFTATGTQQLLDGIEGSGKMVSVTSVSSDLSEGVGGFLSGSHAAEPGVFYFLLLPPLPAISGSVIFMFFVSRSAIGSER